MDAREAWLNLRHSLANPPGAAAVTESRANGLYVACILQFEQLVKAAEAVASHARPLPLYYAAMHGAKALAAAFGSDEAPRWHGLQQVPVPVPDDVMAFEVEPTEGASVLTALCELTASGRVDGPVKLGDLFLSLPDLAEKPHSIEGSRARHVNDVPEDLSLYPVTDAILHVCVESGWSHLPTTQDEYPTLDGWAQETRDGATTSDRRQPATMFGRKTGPRERFDTLEALAPTYRFSGERFLIPKIDNTTGVLSPLTTWYALLFGFSILARYEPDTWLAALDAREPHAAAIEAALEEATAALPELVWKHVGVVLATERLALSEDPSF